MDRTSGGTPLLSLDAVVIDSETTGLDPRKARVIELAGVRLSGGKLAGDNSFRRLLRPAGELIPAETTRIHGIDDAMVAESPLFADVWPDFKAFLGKAVVIGHTVGFDLAVLKRECDLAGLAWKRPTHARHAAVGADRRTGTGRAIRSRRSAAWLDVDATDRHSALGDAKTTARVFLALVPKLRDDGIRTIAEAERACLALTSVLDDQMRIGWIDAVEAPARADAERTLERFDSYAYRHRNRDIMRTPPVFVEAGISVHDALARLAKERISSVFVRLVRRFRRRQGGGGRHRHRTRSAACDRPVRRRRARLAGRADHEPAARGGTSGCFRLSRNRPHESSQDPPSRRRRRSRPRGRRDVRAGPAAPARRGGYIARRRDRRCGGRARPGGCLGEAAAGRAIAAGGGLVRRGRLRK